MNQKSTPGSPTPAMKKGPKPPSKAAGDGSYQKRELRPLIANYQRLIYALVAFADVSVIFYLIVYFQSRVWQVLIAPGILLGALVLAPFVYMLANRGHTILSGLLMVTGMAIAYGANEIAWIGLLPFHVIGGLLLIIVGGSIILPRRKWLWIVGAAFYSLFLVGVNLFPPIQRIPQEQLSPLLPYAIGTNFLLVIALIFQFFMQTRSGSLRNRLVMMIVLLVFIPMAVVGTLISIFTIQGSQTQFLNQLNTIVTLKADTINKWTDSLQSSLQMVMPSSSELGNINALLTKTDPSDVLTYQSVYADTQAKYLNLISYPGYYEEVYLLDLEKRVILSTNGKSVGLIRAELMDFDKALTDTHITPIYLSPGTGLPVMAVEIPIRNNSGQTIAVLAGQVNLDFLSRLMSERTGLGVTGETYLIDRDRRLLTITKSPTSQPGDKVPDTLAPGQVSGSGIYPNYSNVLVSGAYLWIDTLQAAVIGEQAQSEVLRSPMVYLGSTIGFTLISILIVVGIGLFITNSITLSLTKLAKVAEQIAGGNLDLTTEISPLREIGTLANAFNSMTAQLRGMASGLEQRIAERMRTLEKRSTQLQLAAEVARDATSIQNLDELLNRSVDLVQQRFGYYHVAIFLVDDVGNYAVLKAATGEAGKQMLEQGHRLRVGEVGIVGHVAREGVVRVAGDVKTDQVYYLNPLLPETRSEAAIPLKLETKLLGVIDIQSATPNAFDDNALYVLQIVADQLAASIQSALLFEETNRALNELEQAYSIFTRESWKDIQHSAVVAGQGIGRSQGTSSRTQRPVGFRYRNLSVEPLYGESKTVQATPSLDAKNGSGVVSASKDSTKLVVPIRVRGQDIGLIEVEFEQPEQASAAAATFDDIANRLALLLENARLLQEAKRMASREQRINLISTQVRSSIDLDTILRNTVREFGKAFGAKQTFVQLSTLEEG